MRLPERATDAGTRRGRTPVDVSRATAPPWERGNPPSACAVRGLPRKGSPSLTVGGFGNLAARGLEHRPAGRAVALIVPDRQHHLPHGVTSGWRIDLQRPHWSAPCEETGPNSATSVLGSESCFAADTAVPNLSAARPGRAREGTGENGRPFQRGRAGQAHCECLSGSGPTMAEALQIRPDFPQSADAVRPRLYQTGTDQVDHLLLRERWIPCLRALPHLPFSKPSDRRAF